MCSQGTGGEPSARNASRSRDEAAAGRWWRRLKVQGGGASTTARGGTSGWCSWQSADANTERLALGARVRYHIYLDHHGFGAHRDACPRRRSACPREDGARKMPLDDRSVPPSLPPSLRIERSILAFGARRGLPLPFAVAAECPLRLKRALDSWHLQRVLTKKLHATRRTKKKSLYSGPRKSRNFRSSQFGSSLFGAFSS